MSKCILVVDIETTDTNPHVGKILEIGIVSLDLETGKIIELFDQVLREDGLTAKHRDSWIFSNSDMTIEEIRNAPPASEVLPQVQAIFDMYPLGVTAFNRNFDVGFLKSRGINCGRDLQDPMLIATNLCKLPSPRGRGWKWPKAQEAYDYFFPDNQYVEAHRGCDDAKHEAEMVYELWKLGLFKI